MNETLWNCGSSSTKMISMTGKKSKFNQIHTTKKYKEHCAYFLRKCPENRRLVLNKEDFGKWAPICKFMNQKIPEEYKDAFPHENKNNEITQELSDMVAKTIQKEQKVWLPIYCTILLISLAISIKWLFF